MPIFTGPEEHGVAAPGCKVDEVDDGLLVESAQDGLDGRKVTLRAGLLQDTESLHSLGFLKNNVERRAVRPRYRYKISWVN